MHTDGAFANLYEDSVEEDFIEQWWWGSEEPWGYDYPYLELMQHSFLVLDTTWRPTCTLLNMFIHFKNLDVV